MIDVLLPALGALALGLLLGAGAVLLVMRRALAGERQRRDDQERRLAHAEAAAQRTPVLEQELHQTREALNARREAMARLEQQVASAQQREKETDKLLADARETMTTQFKALASELLEEKGALLGKQQKEALATLLNPFGEKLQEFKAKVEQSREDDLKARSGLFAEIKHLTELNQNLSARAQSLTDALRGESKTRGIWGEQVLLKLLELAGLREDVNFRTQASHREEGSSARLVPDVVLDLPQDRAIIIDSKVSLVAYERHVEARDDDTARAQALKDHCASVRRHIKDLSEKNYPKLYGLKSVDFTLLFVPIESALMTASEADPTLAQYALERHIALVSPNTLFTVLRTIEYIWRVEKTTRNMDKIVSRGEQMYNAARRFGEHIVAINDALDKASTAARDAEKALTDPSRGLVKQAERLRALGVKPRKPMPDRLGVDATSIDDEDADEVEDDEAP